MTNLKILAIIANHTSTNIKYNISLNNILYIEPYVQNITIIDSDNELYSTKLYNDIKEHPKINNYFFVPNDTYFDFGKWITALNRIDYMKYDYILFLNDSIILLEEVLNFFIYLNNLETQVNLYGYNDSTQIKYHYQSYFFAVKNNTIPKFIAFFESKRYLINNLESLIHNVELELVNLDDNRDCLIKIGNDYNLSKNLYWENEDLYKYLITKKIFSIIKLKKIFDIQKDYKITIYGSNINNFDHDFYKNYYELNISSNHELLEHFIQIGQYEGRKPNVNFPVILPDYYREKLSQIGILYFFDVPLDFDIYYYKKNNNDLQDLSNIEAIYHYINNGYQEGRSYKNISYNEYLNNYYLNILKKYNFFDNIIIPLDSTFNLHFYLHLNNDLNNQNKGYIGALKYYLENDIKNNFIINKADYDKLLLEFEYNIYKKKYPRVARFSNNDIIQDYLNNDYKKNISYSIPKDFNHNVYKKIYDDLHNMKESKLREHYVLHGINENRIYKIPDDFNYSAYKKNYDDLKNMTNTQLKEHYLFNGIREGRTYLSDELFNSKLYTTIYPDLEGLSNIKLKEHYNNIGKKEGRLYKVPDDFNYEVYKKIYKELDDKSDIELEIDYLSNYKNKIYKIPNDFDPKMYKILYDDLKDMENNNLELHYLFYGYKENRIYKIPHDFNIYIYKNFYKLLDMNDEEIIKHYFDIGIKNNYIYKLPNDFDSYTYSKIYQDIDGMSYDNIIDHYIKFGYNEGRIYKLPLDFNPEEYQKIYDDLSDFNNSQLKNHYLFNGIREGRIYKNIDKSIKKNDFNNLPKDFDYKVYKKLYSDLKNMSITELKKHYMNSGIKEGRIYKIPDDFNPIMYKFIYDDLKNMNDNELLIHYVNNGVKEKRLYKPPNDFNTQKYKNLNNDLKDLDDDNLIKHYILYGINENRSYN